jgi:hypothetical protein
MSRSYDPRSRIRESLDAADVVEVAVSAQDKEVEARLLTAEDNTVYEGLQFEDRGIGLTAMRAAPGVDDNREGKVQIELDVDEWEL